MVCQTPTSAEKTPTSKLNIGLLSCASPGKSQCPPSSARRALFPSNNKKLPSAKDPPKKLDEIAMDDDKADDKAEDPSTVAEEKHDETQTPKNKRNIAARKGAGAGKKRKQ